MVQVRLLGGVGAATESGEPLDVGPAKCQLLLAALALAVPEPVPVARLIDVIWDEAPPRTADKTLQGYAAQLRRGLGRDVVARVGAAYRLELEPEQVDVARFRRRLAAGDIDGALAAWTGAPLAGLDAAGLRPAVDGLVEQWLGAVETHLGRQVIEDAAATVAPLTELTAAHPFREELWALLMSALYRTGRQADALAAFQRARTHLIDELGIEPGPRLREVERKVLAHDQTLQSGTQGVGAGTDADATGGPVLSGLLPGRAKRLLGRGADLDALTEAVASSPVVTLAGPGGVGKTSLALAAAHRVADEGRRRVRLVELGEIAASADVPNRVAETLGVGGGAGRTLTESIAAALRVRPTLLVLDNCEHVVEGAAELVQAITDVATGLCVLATSREPLGVPAEQVMTVPPLDVRGAAVELFAERARAVDGRFDLDDARTEVEEICRRLDGLPLAIELAAARTTSLTPAELLARLDDRLRLLGGRRAVADRHRTLRATVQWSYDLLTPEQQRLFERLAVFAGAFDLAAAEAVATDDAIDAIDVDRLLGDLVQRSLVTVESGPPGRRFRLLETLRQFARQALAEGGDGQLVAARHARWCRDQTADIGRLLAGRDEIEGVARLGERWADLRAAVEWAGTTGDADLADALVHPVAAEVSLRRQVEIGDWAERILELTPPGDEPRTVFWLLWAGHRRAQADAPEEYEALVRRHGYAEHPVVRFNDTYMANVGADSLAVSLAAIEWLREHGEDHAANLLEVSGYAASLIVLQRFDELADVAAELVRRHRHGPPTLHYFALGMQAYAAQYRGRHEEARRLFDEAERLDLPAGTYRVLQTAQARLTFEHGDHVGACRILRDNIEALLDSDYTDVTRMVAVEFVPMMAALDRLADAARVLPYLDTTGDFAAMARTHLIAEPVRRIESDPTVTGHLDADPDAAVALAHMRDVLDDVVARGSR